MTEAFLNLIVQTLNRTSYKIISLTSHNFLSIASSIHNRPITFRSKTIQFLVNPCLLILINQKLGILKSPLKDCLNSINSLWICWIRKTRRHKSNYLLNFEAFIIHLSIKLFPFQLRKKAKRWRTDSASNFSLKLQKMHKTISSPKRRQEKQYQVLELTSKKTFNWRKITKTI